MADFSEELLRQVIEELQLARAPGTRVEIVDMGLTRGFIEASEISVSLRIIPAPLPPIPVGEQARTGKLAKKMGDLMLENIERAYMALYAAPCAEPPAEV